MKNFKAKLLAVSLGLLFLSGCGGENTQSGFEKGGKGVEVVNEYHLKLACQYEDNETDLKSNRYLILNHHKNHRWENNTVKWWYNPNYQVYSTSNSLETIQKAMNSWESVCGIKFSYQGITYQKPSVNKNDKFVIGWISSSEMIDIKPENASAIAPSSSNEIYIDDAEILINYDAFQNLIDSDISWDYSTIPISQFQGVMTHELGHVIGIDHSDVEGAVMSGTSSGTKYVSFDEQRVLKNDDIRAARALYPMQTRQQDDPSASISNLMVSSITSHSATITWRGDPTARTWVYVHAPYYSTGSKHNTSNSRYTYSSLASGTTFTVYVKDDYGNVLQKQFTTNSTQSQRPSTSQYYGAFAYSRQTSRWGYSWRYETQYYARNSAISSCGRSDCKVLQDISGNECMAYAETSGGGGYWSVKMDKSSARSSALRSCNYNLGNCRISFSVCANGR